MMSGINSESLAEKLQKAGVDITAVQKEVESDINNPSGSPSPWFVNILIGFGAWAASLLFIMALFSMLKESNGAVGVIGVILIIATAGSRYLPSRNIFITQLSLSLCIAGQVLIMIWCIDKTHFKSEGSLPMVLMAMETVLIVVYRDAVIRFLAVILFVVGSIWLFHDIHVPEAVHIVSIPLAFISGYVWVNESRLFTGKFSEIVTPVGYASAAALLLLPVISIIHRHAHDLFSVNHWWITTMGVAAVLLYAGIIALESRGVRVKSKEFYAIALCVLAFSLLSQGSPGIIIAAGMLSIGFYRGNRVIMGLSIGFFLIFMFEFYYYMEVTLLIKSFILMGSGVFLIALWLAFRRYISHENGMVDDEK
jgi:uncharacterized membrane protein